MWLFVEGVGEGLAKFGDVREVIENHIPYCESLPKGISSRSQIDSDSFLRTYHELYIFLLKKLDKRK